MQKHINWRNLVLSLAITLTAGLLPQGAAFSHAGHGVKDITPPKGGVLRDLKELYLELVRDGNISRVYVYDHDLKPLDASKQQATFTVTLPKKDPQALTPAVKNDHWEINYDPKGAHRYTLKVVLKEPDGDSKAEWVIEPRKK